MYSEPPSKYQSSLTQAGSDMGDAHNEYVSGDQALKASGKDNTMNQF